MDITPDEVEEVQKFRTYLADPAARAAFVDLKAQHAEGNETRRYQHIQAAIVDRPWAIRGSVLDVIVDLVAFRAAGGRLTAEEIEGRVGAVRREPSRQAPSGVARIPISGVLVPKASAFNDMSGGTSAEQISGMLASAVASPDVASIVLDVDSPGGMVDGIPELAAEIRAARERKPIVAVANTEAASAAYWLASQASRVVASPSARVGSIGVITAHEDRSARDEQRGIKTKVVSAGRYKAEGSPHEALSEEGEAHLQSMVNEFYGMFVDAVASARGVKASDVRDGYGEGRILTASQALSAGLIDEVGTLDAVLGAEVRNAALNASTTVEWVAVDPSPVLTETQTVIGGLATNADDLLQELRAAEAGIPSGSKPEPKESGPDPVSEIDAIAADLAALMEE